jgi:hypothetical protein
LFFGGRRDYHVCAGFVLGDLLVLDFQDFLEEIYIGIAGAFQTGLFGLAVVAVNKSTDVDVL